MDLKFYLNKFLKVDNIEHYTLNSLYKLKKVYDDFLDKSEGVDPDFPGMILGDHGNGEKIKGTNYFSLFGGEENIPEGHKGILEDKIELSKNKKKN